MLPRSLQDISIADLQSLIDAGVREGRAIDYKAEPPAGGDGAKKEFLADISSFANSGGGHLVIGVKSKGGIPTTFNPTKMDDPEKEVLRLENLVRDGVDPRIAGVSSKYLHRDGGFVFVMSIPQSWNGPHMVTLLNSSRFFSRNSGGKYQLDVREIGEAFLTQEELPERLRRFRRERVTAIVARQTAPSLLTGGKVILHVVPFSSGRSPRLIDIDAAIGQDLHPLGTTFVSGRHNFDGYLACDQDKDGNTRRYIQIFRDGSLEAVDAYLLAHAEANIGRRLIPSISFEQKIIVCVRDCIRALYRLDVQFPVAVMISLTGADGCAMGVSQRWDTDESMVIDRDEVLVPEVIFDNASDVPEKILRPAFDVVWNSAGWRGSINYDETGEWHDRQ
jgi:hypothetical protein